MGSPARPAYNRKQGGFRGKAREERSDGWPNLHECKQAPAPFCFSYHSIESLVSNNLCAGLLITHLHHSVTI